MKQRKFRKGKIMKICQEFKRKCSQKNKINLNKNTILLLK